MEKSKKMEKQRGQVLLITTLVLMSTFALAISVGGLALFNIRASVSAGESTKAIYAAESCIESSLYSLNKTAISMPEMTNGTEYKKIDLGPGSLRCSGSSGRVNRAFEIQF